MSVFASASSVFRVPEREAVDRDVESGDVRVADEGLRVRGDEVEVEARDGLCRAEPALERLDDVDLRVGEEGVQVLARLLGSPAT